MFHGHGEKLTRNWERAIAALMSSRTAKEAAQKIGVSEKTLGRWMRVESFRVAYYRARREALGQTFAFAQQAAPSAVWLLARIVRDDNSPAATRVKAACALLEFARTGIHDEEFDLRLSLLENASASREAID